MEGMKDSDFTVAVRNAQPTPRKLKPVVLFDNERAAMFVFRSAGYLFKTGLFTRDEIRQMLEYGKEIDGFSCDESLVPPDKAPDVKHIRKRKRLIV